jgi:WD40 repeat protein
MYDRASNPLQELFPRLPFTICWWCTFGYTLCLPLSLFYLPRPPLPQSHEASVRSMEWSHNGMWMATTDDRGTVKYWQSNMNNVHSFQAHNETIRGCRWDARPKTTGSGTLSSSGSGCLHVTVSPVCLVLCCCVCAIYYSVHIYTYSIL